MMIRAGSSSSRAASDQDLQDPAAAALATRLENVLAADAKEKMANRGAIAALRK